MNDKYGVSVCAFVFDLTLINLLILFFTSLECRTAWSACALLDFIRERKLLSFFGYSILIVSYC